MNEVTGSPPQKRSASASGIEDVTCPRKFAFRNLLPKGERAPPSDAALFGKRLHKIAEDYHKEAKPFDPKSPEGKAFLKGLHFNPPPMQWKVEGYFKLDVMGIEFRGYKDLETFGRGIDHKTSSAPLKAAESLEPESNAQGLIYALDGMHRYDTSRYSFEWIFYPSPKAPKTGPGSEVQRVVHEYDADSIIDQFWEHCYKPALQIAFIRANWTGDPMDFRGNYSYCHVYGGCPYRVNCGVIVE